MKNVSFMPHTAVKGFFDDRVEMEKDGESVSVPPFQTVILASGMLPVPLLQEDGVTLSPRVEVIGDANKVMDILNAVEAGYQLAVRR